MDTLALVNAIEAARSEQTTSAVVTDVWLTEAEHRLVETLARSYGVSIKAMSGTLITWGLDELEAMSAGTEPLVAALEAAKVQRERPMAFNISVSDVEFERLRQLAPTFGLSATAMARTVLAWAAGVLEAL